MKAAEEVEERHNKGQSPNLQLPKVGFFFRKMIFIRYKF